MENLVREILEQEREDAWIRVAASSLLGSLGVLREWATANDASPPSGAIARTLHRLADAYTDLHPLAQKMVDYGLQVALREMLHQFGVSVP